MIKNLNVEIMFDNGGGATAKFGTDYVHYTDNMEQLAECFKTYEADENTNDWEGNDGIENWMEYDSETSRNGGAKWYDYEDICKMRNEYADENEYWGDNVTEFIKALV